MNKRNPVELLRRAALHLAWQRVYERNETAWHNLMETSELLMQLAKKVEASIQDRRQAKRYNKAILRLAGEGECSAT